MASVRKLPTAQLSRTIISFLCSAVLTTSICTVFVFVVDGVIIRTHVRCTSLNTSPCVSCRQQFYTLLLVHCSTVQLKTEHKKPKYTATLQVTCASELSSKALLLGPGPGTCAPITAMGVWPPCICQGSVVATDDVPAAVEAPMEGKFA